MLLLALVPVSEVEPTGSLIQAECVAVSCTQGAVQGRTIKLLHLLRAQFVNQPHHGILDVFSQSLSPTACGSGALDTSTSIVRRFGLGEDRIPTWHCLAQLNHHKAFVFLFFTEINPLNAAWVDNRVIRLVEVLVPVDMTQGYITRTGQ